MHFNRSLLSLALVSTLLLTACEKNEQNHQQMPPMPVSTIVVATEEVRIATTLPGRISATKNAEIRARVTGLVQSINFEQGSKVKQGQLLFKIDPSIYQANVNAAQAALAQAQANAKNASTLANRYQTLIKANAVSRQEYDSAMASTQVAEAAIESAKAALETAQINLSYTDVTSPIDGIVGGAEVTEGALVQAGTATLLATVQNLSEVYVDFTQSTTELNQLRKSFASGDIQQLNNDQAAVHLILEDGSTYQHQGKLLFSGVSVDPNTGKVKLRATFPNPNEELLPGMFVRVSLERGIQHAAIAVPAQAVQRRTDGSNLVFIVEEGRVAARPVTLGENAGDKIVILSGLNVGDQLIVEGFTKIGPGAPVNPSPWSKAPQAATNQNTSEATQ